MTKLHALEIHEKVQNYKILFCFEQKWAQVCSFPTHTSYRERVSLQNLCRQLALNAFHSAFQVYSKCTLLLSCAAFSLPFAAFAAFEGSGRQRKVYLVSIAKMGLGLVYPTVDGTRSNIITIIARWLVFDGSSEVSIASICICKNRFLRDFSWIRSNYSSSKNKMGPWNHSVASHLPHHCDRYTESCSHPKTWPYQVRNLRLKNDPRVGSGRQREGSADDFRIAPSEKKWSNCFA